LTLDPGRAAAIELHTQEKTEKLPLKPVPGVLIFPSLRGMFHRINGMGR